MGHTVSHPFFVRNRNRGQAAGHILVRKEGGGADVSGRAELRHRHVCHRHGMRDPDRGHFSHGDADVSGGHAADRQRLRLLETVERSLL